MQRGNFPLQCSSSSKKKNVLDRMDDDVEKISGFGSECDGTEQSRANHETGFIVPVLSPVCCAASFLFFVSNMNISFLILSLNASQLAKKRRLKSSKDSLVSFNFILYTHFHSDLGGPTLWFRCLLLSSASLLFLPAQAREGIDKKNAIY